MKNYKKKELLTEFLAIFIIVGLILFAGLFGKGNSDIDKENLERFNVTEVVDGDTIYVCGEDGKNIKVRYIGIDAPELSDYLGMKASKRNFELIEKAGDTVYLSYGKEKYDKYGRTLAYVYVDLKDDGLTMIEDVLLSEGLAKTMEIEPNTEFSSHFNTLEKAAERDNKGIWSR